MLTNLDKAPFPYFGGKRDAAEIVWAALGDVAHYVEPFAGSLAVLLGRPHEANRTYFSETVNDLDGFVVNAWRAIQADPVGVADAASNPVAEADLHARHVWLVQWRAAGGLDQLLIDPVWYDTRAAGWWLWGVSSWIGSGWCSGTGAWTVIDEQFVKQDRAGTREPGVTRQLPHLSDDGRGVNHAGTREPGVGEPHPTTMPELVRWMQFLAARLRHVRILNGDWSRAVTSGAINSLPVRGKGFAGVFLDPPYDTTIRDADLYTEDAAGVADDVRDWCRENGDNPKYRIVLAGFDVEHESLEADGWRVEEWYRSGFLKGGMGNTSVDGHQQKRERLWFSPHCIGTDSNSLF